MNNHELKQELQEIIQLRQDLQTRLNNWDKQFRTRNIITANPDEPFIELLAQEYNLFLTLGDAYKLYVAGGGHMLLKAFCRALKFAGYTRRAIKYNHKLVTFYAKDGVDFKILWSNYLVDNNKVQ